MRAFPRFAAAHFALGPIVLSIDPDTPSPPPAAALAMGDGVLFFAIEMEVYQPGDPVVAERGWFARPRFAPAPLPGPLESTETIRASDLGYVTRETDVGGIQTYPPALKTAFAIDRRMPLAPNSPAAAAGWGSVDLANLGRRYDAIAVSRNADGRSIRLLAGRKIRDETRGLDVDPPRNTLAEVFTGIAQPWVLTEDVLSIPLRDASYWLEQPFQRATFAGTGEYEGAADLEGRRKPRARGGSPTLPIRDVSPVWIDRVNGVLCLSDAPGAVFALSENGDPAQIDPEGGSVATAEVADLYTGSTTPGHYRWCSRAEGLFVQLGSPTTGIITCDVAGYFPSGTAEPRAAALASRLLSEDMALPPWLLDDGSFSGLAAARPWTAGDYWDGSQEVNGKDAAALFLASVGARLVPDRTGPLRAYPLRAIAADARPAVAWSTAQIVDCKPAPDRLRSAGVSPQPYRWRVTYSRCNTLITSNLDVDVTEARKSFLTQEYRYAAWSSVAITAAYRRPLDPDAVITRLLDGGDATLLATSLGELWSGSRPPRLHTIEIRFAEALAREIGDVVQVTYPLDDLDGGRLGQIVGESIRSSDNTVTFEVLV